ncbi:hypothetical protein [Massilia eburnea]|nr:hypothetical protein [Massilia eburnea]
MNSEIFPLSEEEIQTIAGGSQIDPQAIMTAATGDFPQIENDPPG